MKLEFNINTDAAVIHTNKLESLPKNALPRAVRGTLNSLAFDVKTNTMPEEVDKTFERRRKTFFKAGSRVEMAKSLDINIMRSSVGFVPFRGNSQAIEDLEQQEHGGLIKSRSFIPMDTARISKSYKRSVSNRNRLKGIRNVVNVSKSRGINHGQKFIKSVLDAGVGGFVLDKNTLFSVKKITKYRGRWRFKLTPIYSYKKSRDVKIKPTNFMSKATEKTAKKGIDIFIKEAKFHIEKQLM